VKKDRPNLKVGAVGKITEHTQAEDIVKRGVDLIFMGREILRDPHWPLKAAKEFRIIVDWPLQYERARL